MENAKLFAQIAALFVGVFTLLAVLTLFYPFVVAIGLKWFAWVAAKAGVDAQLLTYCCYLLAIAQAVGRKREIAFTPEQLEALRRR